MPTSSPPFSSPFPELRPPPAFMSSRRAETGGSIRLIVAGELDLAARHNFMSALAEAQDHSDRVLLDLRALSFIDCACIAGLFAAARRGRPERSALVLVSPRGQVRRVLELVGSPPGVAVLDHVDLPEHRGPVAA